jgi:hypothetical protein
VYNLFSSKRTFNWTSYSHWQMVHTSKNRWQEDKFCKLSHFSSFVHSHLNYTLNDKCCWLLLFLLLLLIINVVVFLFLDCENRSYQTAFLLCYWSSIVLFFCLIFSNNRETFNMEREQSRYWRLFWIHLKLKGNENVIYSESEWRHTLLRWT